MHAFIKFNKGIMSMPIYWQLWLMLLVTFNLIIPLFFGTSTDDKTKNGGNDADQVIFSGIYKY